jgi:hypothetical protein
MLFLEIYMGLCIVSFPLMLLLFKTAPLGWEDKNGYHQKSNEEKLIPFPLKKRVARDHLTINFKLAHYQKLDSSNFDLQITLGV